MARRKGEARVLSPLPALGSFSSMNASPLWFGFPVDRLSSQLPAPKFPNSQKPHFPALALQPEGAWQLPADALPGVTSPSPACSSSFPSISVSNPLDQFPCVHHRPGFCFPSWPPTGCHSSEQRVDGIKSRGTTRESPER